MLNQHQDESSFLRPLLSCLEWEIKQRRSVPTAKPTCAHGARMETLWVSRHITVQPCCSCHRQHILPLQSICFYLEHASHMPHYVNANYLLLTLSLYCSRYAFLDMVQNMPKTFPSTCLPESKPCSGTY